MTVSLDRAAAPARAPLLDATLRGLGQVAFQNSPLAGALFLAAAFAGSARLGLGALVGALASTATGRLLRAPVADGLCGFNGALVGLALALFLEPSPGAWALLVGASAAAGSVMAGLLARPLGPALTAPFIAITLACLGAAPRLGLVRAASTLAASAAPLGVADLGLATLKGLGEVFLLDSAPAGALVLLGLLAGSRRAGLTALAGALLGALVAWGAGLPAGEIRLGLHSYNAALVAVALGSALLPPGRAAALAALAGAAASTLLGAWLARALGALGLPALTSAFVLVTWVLLAVARSRRG